MRIPSVSWLGSASLTLFLICGMGTNQRLCVGSRTQLGGGGRRPWAGEGGRSQWAGPLTVGSGVQPAHRGPSGRAARRSASVSSGTRARVTGGTAAVPARRASGASGARTVSAGLWREGLRAGGTLQTPLPSPPAECQPGFFGPGCRQACTCPPGVACDPVSGQCGKQCPAGYQGEDCGQGERPALVCGWGAGCLARAGRRAPEVLVLAAP